MPDLRELQRLIGDSRTHWGNLMQSLHELTQVPGIVLSPLVEESVIEIDKLRDYLLYASFKVSSMMYPDSGGCCHEIAEEMEEKKGYVIGIYPVRSIGNDNQ